MLVKIATRTGKVLIDQMKLKDDAKVDEIMHQIARFRAKYSIHRQRLTFEESSNKKPVLLEQGKLLTSYGIKDGSVILFKDLGPQIGWKTVFLIEYFGPILIHGLFFLRPDIAYGTKGFNHSIEQIIGVLFVFMHFTKRELETVYIHRFSNATMPLKNLPKNCFHYWVLGGLMV